ncbi:nucleic acid-binding, OB-fold-like protein isoform X2 [Wolffia australiana]
MANKGASALRQFTRCKPRTGGRNSQGRITAFHRGGGAKQLLRKIDLKRNVSGVGIVERIEYDPNRSSKIALVRWIEGGSPRPRVLDRRLPAENLSSKEILESNAAISDGGRFSFSTLPGGVEQTRFGSLITPSSSLGLRGLPRIAVAGAKPSFFASRLNNDSVGDVFPLSKIQEWRPDREIWVNRMKRKAAISWQSLRSRSSRASSKSDRGLLGLLRPEDPSPSLFKSKSLSL